MSHKSNDWQISQTTGWHRTARQRVVWRASLETAQQDDSATTLATGRKGDNDKGCVTTQRAMYQISHPTQHYRYISLYNIL
jgi:hypothetical protein